MVLVLVFILVIVVALVIVLVLGLALALSPNQVTAHGHTGMRRNILELEDLLSINISLFIFILLWKC